VDASGSYGFSTPYGTDSTELESIYLEESDDIDSTKVPLDTTLETECVETYCTVGGLPTDCSTPLAGLNVASNLMVTGPYPIPGDVTIDIGYKLTSTLEGWFTVLDGDIYSGSGFTMVVPQEPAIPLIYDPYLTNSFVLSSGALTVRDSDTPQNERIIPDGSGSYGYGFSTNQVNLSVLRSDFPANDDLELITSLSNLDPSNVYYIEEDDLDDILASDKEYSSNIESDGVVVIKTDGAIEFTHSFYTNDPDKKILFITADTVSFDETLGVDLPLGNGTDDPRIDVGIFTLDNINFPSAGSEDGDTTLVINGLLVSGDTVNFNRDRELQNIYPGVAIHYDPAYAYYLQKQMQDTPGYAEEIMALVNISWDIED